LIAESDHENAGTQMFWKDTWWYWTLNWVFGG